MKIEFLKNLYEQLEKIKKTTPSKYHNTVLEKLKENRIGTLFWIAYKQSRELEFLNFDFVMDESLIGGAVLSMRIFGIKEFTVSIQGNNAIKSIKKFVDSGCEITGVTTVKLFKEYPAIKLRVLD